jgi:hypothetical protein
MTVNDFKRKVCDAIELYADRPEHFYGRHEGRILELARCWGATVFLGALETCCAAAALPFFFSGDPEQWREAYLESRRFRPEAQRDASDLEKPYAARRGLTIEFAPETNENSEDDRSRVGQFLSELKEACRSGKIRELAAQAASRYF